MGKIVSKFCRKCKLQTHHVLNPHHLVWVCKSCLNLHKEKPTEEDLA